MSGQRIKVWTRGGHVITGTVYGDGSEETLRRALEHIGSDVPTPVAATPVIEIPQEGDEPVKVVLDRIEAWYMAPEQ